MPSSGFPIENFQTEKDVDAQMRRAYLRLERRALLAMSNGLFTEWMESFVGAYNHIRNTNPAMAGYDRLELASDAGVTEWDM